jgi:hypothetical protein
VRDREREIQRERQRERQRDRETERQRQRQRETETERDRDRERKRESKNTWPQWLTTRLKINGKKNIPGSIPSPGRAFKRSREKNKLKNVTFIKASGAIVTSFNN